jgi:N-acetylneuraminate synthase
MRSFSLGKRKVGDGAPCLIVAEVAQAHDGSLGMAHAYIDAIAKAEAHAVKFQCHIAEAESTPDEPWRVEPEWAQDASRYDYWKRMEFTPEQWWSLAVHATEVGLIFLCSPFSVEAVKMLDPLVPAWKVPSGEIRNGPLLRAIAETGKPCILSTGMCTNAEEDRATFWLQSLGCKVCVLQCTSIYPCPPEKTGISCPIAGNYDGLSDHSGTIYAGLAAVALGASILEVHVCFSREQFGFDVTSSVTIEQLRQLVEGGVQIKDGFEFQDPVTGLCLKVVRGVKLDRLHVEIGEAGAPKIKNRDFFFTRDGKFDGTGSACGA